MEWALIAAVMVSFGLTAALLCSSYLRSKAKRESRQVGYRRGEILVDSADVPEFKPTWRDLR